MAVLSGTRTSIQEQFEKTKRRSSTSLEPSMYKVCVTFSPQNRREKISQGKLGSCCRMDFPQQMPRSNCGIPNGRISIGDRNQRRTRLAGTPLSFLKANCTIYSRAPTALRINTFAPDRRE